MTTPGLVVPADQLPAGALRPVRPAYGSGSLADLLPSVSALLGVPGAVDVLGLRERLDGVRRVAVLLVDGLGAYQIPVAAPYAPVLADLGSRTLTAGFPSTTPVSLATIGTGAPPGAHGILGFTLRRGDGRIVNHIRWADDPDPLAWQPVPTRFAAAAAAGVEVSLVTRPEFDGSGLTVAAYRGARFVGSSGPEELADRMISALSAGDGPALVYGYHGDLDKAGHEDGVDSVAWREAARGVGVLVDRLVHSLPPAGALLVIADHGQLNVPVAGRFDVSDISGLVGVSGEPRVRYLHVAAGALGEVMAACRAIFGDSAAVLTRDQVIAEGWFGPVADAHRDRIGDVVVICHDRVVALAGGYEPPAVGRLIGYHGSVTAAEMTVPLLIANFVRGSG